MYNPNYLAFRDDFKTLFDISEFTDKRVNIDGTNSENKYRFTNIETGKTWVVGPLEFRTFLAYKLYKFLLGEHAANVAIVKEGDNYLLGSEFIENFKPIAQWIGALNSRSVEEIDSFLVYLTRGFNMKGLKVQETNRDSPSIIDGNIVLGAEKLLPILYLVGESDPHCGNIGLKLVTEKNQHNEKVNDIENINLSDIEQYLLYSKIDEDHAFSSLKDRESILEYFNFNLNRKDYKLCLRVMNKNIIIKYLKLLYEVESDIISKFVEETAYLYNNITGEDSNWKQFNDEILFRKMIIPEIIYSIDIKTILEHNDTNELKSLISKGVINLNSSIGYHNVIDYIYNHNEDVFEFCLDYINAKDHKNQFLIRAISESKYNYIELFKNKNMIEYNEEILKVSIFYKNKTLTDDILSNINNPAQVLKNLFLGNYSKSNYTSEYLLELTYKYNPDKISEIVDAFWKSNLLDKSFSEKDVIKILLHRSIGEIETLMNLTINPDVIQDIGKVFLDQSFPPLFIREFNRFGSTILNKLEPEFIVETISSNHNIVVKLQEIFNGVLKHIDIRNKDFANQHIDLLIKLINKINNTDYVEDNGYVNPRMDTEITCKQAYEILLNQLAPSMDTILAFKSNVKTSPLFNALIEKYIVENNLIDSSIINTHNFYDEYSCYHNFDNSIIIKEDNILI